MTIGVTSDELAQQTRDEPRPVPPLEERIENVESVANEYAKETGSEIVVNELTHPFEAAVNAEDHTHIVVSPEEKTQKRCEQINTQRKENGVKPLEVITVEPLIAEDGKRISSTRIVNGEIDKHGNVLD